MKKLKKKIVDCIMDSDVVIGKDRRQIQDDVDGWIKDSITDIIRGHPTDVISLVDMVDGRFMVLDKAQLDSQLRSIVDTPDPVFHR